MSKRKSGEFIETVADFWLGMAGAAAKGFAEMTKRRQDRKQDNAEGDIVDDFTLGMDAAFDQAKDVVDRAVRDLAPSGTPSKPKSRKASGSPDRKFREKFDELADKKAPLDIGPEPAVAGSSRKASASAED